MAMLAVRICLKLLFYNAYCALSHNTNLVVKEEDGRVGDGSFGMFKIGLCSIACEQCKQTLQTSIVCQPVPAYCGCQS